MPPLISICIPTYHRPDYLQKLFTSIEIQDFKDFDIVITDNSTDDSVLDLVNLYSNKFKISYYRNTPAVSMTENWNNCIKKATGTWIKVMHSDDSFAGKGALSAFAEAAKKKPAAIFSALYVHNETFNTTKIDKLNPSEVELYSNNPFLLLYNNLVGSPSTCMVRNDINELYDPRLGWIVDIDYYFRIISHSGFSYIPEPIINMTQNETQVTQDCFRNKAVEIPEGLILLQKYGSKLTGNITQYNSWWRFIRNMNIRSVEECRQYAKGYEIPKFLVNIINFQKRIPETTLSNRYVSRLFMTLHYFFGFKLNISMEMTNYSLD